MITTQVTTNTMKQSNDLRFTTTKTVGNIDIIVKIRLNDQCNNGHQDFSITGDIYKASKPRTDSNHISGGCIHDKIAKYFPEFKQFINLHLCDWNGIPMYAVENGFYHLQNGFNNTPKTDPKFKSEFCEYYRVTAKQYDALNGCNNQIQYAIALQTLGILDQWKNDADKAIKVLEELTGTKFVVDSKRTQYNAPTPEQLKEEEERIKSGYYTPEQIEQRKQDAINKELQSMEYKACKKCNEIQEELSIKKQLFILGGEKYRSATIFYKHTRTIKFNWSTDKLTDNEIEHIKANLVLPDGVTYQ